MIANSKPRRQTAGFIRTTSHKALPTFNRQQRNKQQSSSDQFSSFENCQKVKQDSQSEFSPYKFNSNLVRPPLPHSSKASYAQSPKRRANWQEERSGSLKNLPNSKSKKDDREKQIRRILEKRIEVQNQLAQIGKICDKISSTQFPRRLRKQGQNKEVDIKRVPVKVKPKEYSFDSQSESESASEQAIDSEVFARAHNNMKQNRNIINDSVQDTKQQKEVRAPYLGKIKSSHRLIHKHQYNFDESSAIQQRQQQDSASFNCFQNDILHRQEMDQEQESEDELKIKHERARQQFIGQNQSDEQEEEDDQQQLIQEYSGGEFKKNLRQCIQQSPSQASRLLQPKYNTNPTITNLPKRLPNKTERKLVTVESPGFHKTKGGICFDLDVNEFTHQQVQNKPNYIKPVPKKPKNKNSKQQILKRRQMAKNYDKQARMRVFGNY